MAKVLVTEDYLEDIGDAIRYKNGQAVNYTPPQMAQAIRNINTGGDLGTKNISANGTYNASSDGYDGYSSVTVNVQPNVGTKSISSNGTYNASSDNYDGYSSVNVNVPNSYSASDEGKVVSSGALVSQTSTTKTANGTYDTTLNNEVVINVESQTIPDATGVSF